MKKVFTTAARHNAFQGWSRTFRQIFIFFLCFNTTNQSHLQNTSYCHTLKYETNYFFSNSTFFLQPFLSAKNFHIYLSLLHCIDKTFISPIFCSMTMRCTTSPSQLYAMLAVWKNISVPSFNAFIIQEKYFD